MYNSKYYRFAAYFATPINEKAPTYRRARRGNDITSLKSTGFRQADSRSGGENCFILRVLRLAVCELGGEWLISMLCKQSTILHTPPPRNPCHARRCERIAVVAVQRAKRPPCSYSMHGKEEKEPSKKLMQHHT